MSLAAFLPGFGNQPGEVGFGKAELAGAGLAPFNEPTPAPVFQVNLQRLADQLVRGAVISSAAACVSGSSLGGTRVSEAISDFIFSA